MPEREGDLESFAAAEAVDFRHAPGNPEPEPTVAAVEGGVAGGADAVGVVGVSKDTREGGVGVTGGGFVWGDMWGVEEGRGGGGEWMG